MGECDRGTVTPGPLGLEASGTFLQGLHDVIATMELTTAALQESN